jgi:hemerythrin
MTLITWRPEFNIGVEPVDQEHRSLIDLINGIDAAMDVGAAHSDVMRALGEVYAQISAHFALEEKIMRNRGYLDYASHKQDHEALLDELLDIIDSVDRDGRYDHWQLSQSMDRWFSDHFRIHDAKLHRLIG